MSAVVSALTTILAFDIFTGPGEMGGFVVLPTMPSCINVDTRQLVSVPEPVTSTVGRETEVVEPPEVASGRLFNGASPPVQFVNMIGRLPRIAPAKVFEKLTVRVPPEADHVFVAGY